MNYEVVLASDKSLFRDVEKLAKEKRAFIIRADRRFRHTERVIRLLKYFHEGVPRSPGFVGWWKRLLDFHYSGDVFGTVELAFADYNYSWRYQYTSEGVDLIFDPPAGEASQGNNRQKNAAD